MKFQSGNSTAQNSINQLRERYNSFIHYKKSFREYVYFLHKSEGYTMQLMADVTGYSKSAIQKIINSVKKEKEEQSCS